MFHMTYSVQDNVTPLLKRVEIAVRSKSLRDVMGRAGRNAMVDNFYKLANERHRPHVAMNFYARAADKTNYHTDSDGATVVVSQEGIRQRLEGGEIKAVNGKLKLLHIPVDVESEGKVPKDFDELVWIVNQRTRRGVVKKPGKDGKVLFALCESVYQDPDPTVLRENEVMDAVDKATRAFCTRYWRHVNG